MGRASTALAALLGLLLVAVPVLAGSIERVTIQVEGMT